MAGGGRDLPAHDIGLRRAKGRSTSKRSIFASKSSVVIVSSPTLACSRPISASRASAGRLFSDASPPARNWSRQPLSSAAVTPSSRETSSRSSPRNRRSTASCLRRADIRRRGSGVGPSPPARWARSAGSTPTPTVSSILTSLQLPTCKAVSQRTVGRGTVPQLGPWLRLQSPLVKPDVRLARIRLSPASSSLRARQVATVERQGEEAEHPVQVLVRVSAVPGASPAAPPHQPSSDPSLDVPAHQAVGPEHRPLVEVRRPAAEQTVDDRHALRGTGAVPSRRGRFVDPLQQATDRLPGRVCADIGHPALAVEPADRVAEEVEAFRRQ